MQVAAVVVAAVVVTIAAVAAVVAVVLRESSEGSDALDSMPYNQLGEGAGGGEGGNASGDSDAVAGEKAVGEEHGGAKVILDPARVKPTAALTAERTAERMARIRSQTERSPQRRVHFSRGYGPSPETPSSSCGTCQSSLSQHTSSGNVGSHDGTSDLSDVDLRV